MVRRRRARGAAAGEGEERPGGEEEEAWDPKALGRPVAGRPSDSDLVCGALVSGLADFAHGDNLGRSAICASRRRDVWTFLELLDCVVGFKEDAEVYEIWTALEQAGLAGRRLYAERLRLAGQVLRGLLLATSCLAHLDGFDRGVEEEYEQLGKAMRIFEGRLKHVSSAVKSLVSGGGAAEQCKARGAAQQGVDGVPDAACQGASKEPLPLDVLSTAGRMLAPFCEIPRSVGACIIWDVDDEVPQGRRARAAARRAAAEGREYPRGSGSILGRYVIGATNYIYCASIGAFIT